MDFVIDLDVAVREIELRRDGWLAIGLTVGQVTWRDQGDGWPPPFKTDRASVIEADSIGVGIRKGDQVGEIVLFRGGWCDVDYWSGLLTDDPVAEAPGYPGGMTVAEYGDALDRLVRRFS